MSKRIQECATCGQQIRHGWPLGRRLYCSLKCLDARFTVKKKKIPV